MRVSNLVWAAVGLVIVLSADVARAEAQRDRFSAGGYFRVMTRPDFQGGLSRLGFWNLYGRLLNEGPHANLELKLDVLQATRPNEAWASVYTRLEANSLPNSDPLNGSFIAGRIAQLYARAGNVLLQNVTWQLGTVDTYFPDLHLYDLKPGQILDQMVGLSAQYTHPRFDLLLGVGDSGWNIRRDQYNSVLTAGAAALVRVVPKHFELGIGGQLGYEPRVEGNRFAPYNTPGVDYEDYYRGEVVQRFLEENPGQEDLFPRPEPTKSRSYRLVGYIGFGGWGPLKWSKITGRYERLHPLNFTTETFNGREFTIYIQRLTDERYHAELGSETLLELWPGRLDALVGLLYGSDINRDNQIAAGEDNRKFYSTVVRLQTYLTRTVHYLLEGSFAQEKSLNGNLFREHYDSVFQSSRGATGVATNDTRGLEFGDSDIRSTTQLKTGFVLNPTGMGIFARPSIRLLYGLQYSTQQVAFGSGFTEDLSQYNYFPGTERHWHSVVALEAEAWF